VKADLARSGVQLYHGLSHELPLGIGSTPIKTVVTMHDLIFERYPAQYQKADVLIYRAKFKYACMHAHRIIAISEQTRRDLVEMYGVNESKIIVCYQSCDPAYTERASDDRKEALRKALELPPHFFLYVGSIIERKNLLNICKALEATTGPARLPLVVIGKGRQYHQKVVQYLASRGLTQRVLFLSQHPAFEAQFQTPQAMSAIYQMATALLYPSLYEGFGIPVLEAMSGGTPVITSNVSCLPETGGDAAFYVDPGEPEEISAAMNRVAADAALRAGMIARGSVHAAKFSGDACTAAVMDVYKTVFDGRDL
jgi:glycosyltransferase involved in cell wall biosynthesis